MRNVVGPSVDGQAATPLFIAVVGGAGTGKSTVVNFLAGSVVADANPQAGPFQPSAMVLDSFANLYIADEVNHVIRRVDFLGRVTTIAGVSGRAGFSTNGTPANEAVLNSPRGVAIGPGDQVFIADTGNHVIRVVERDGTIKTFAGSGSPGFGGDFGFASNAVFNTPTGLAINAAGDLYRRHR